jgi:hypothetical protein
MGRHTTERKQVMRTLAAARKLARGLESQGHLLTRLVMRGKRITVKQLQASLKPIIAAADKAEASKLAAAKDLAARDTVIGGKRGHVRDALAAVAGFLGSGHPASTEFGLPSGKRRKRTQAEEAISAALRRQTRKTRGTMGAKQRAAVTVEGSPGLLVVDPSGKPISGVGLPPIPPGGKQK